jgi:guanylate kinase
VHYRFITLPEFDKHIEDGDFLEWAVVHGLNKYGSLCGPIEEALTAGHPALLEIDLQGARQLRERLAEIGVEADFVFLAPPSFEELVTRLGMRGTESLEERQKRLETAHEEMAAQDEFDFVVTNHEVDQAVDDLAGIMGLSAGAPGAN